MLDRVRGMTSNDEIAYEADLEDARLPKAEYDVVFSALTCHYLEKLLRLMIEISGTLKTGGSLVFSAEHPLFTAPTEPGLVTDPGWDIELVRLTFLLMGARKN
ncbi:putative SAM-dependent methyltransferase [Rosellinia necatrix]|uniref:Putative SAM-dependent methyltransferase n=1 Tax=Rosellinia necatrix TaxID=77044 RepID=A0A1S8ABG2_ROSNE|nr:putative SAM-dependent methyltransferase [Rosellinia necatrix]